jgi:hypothetical protein
MNELFQESFKSDFTKNAYNFYLKKYGLDKLSIIDPKLVEDEIIRFILQLKRKGKGFTSIENYVKAIIYYFVHPRYYWEKLINYCFDHADG